MNENDNKIVESIKEMKEFLNGLAPIFIDNAYNLIKNRNQNPLDIEITLENLAAMIDYDGAKDAFKTLYYYYRFICKEDAEYAFDKYKEYYDLDDSVIKLER